MLPPRRVLPPPLLWLLSLLRLPLPSPLLLLPLLLSPLLPLMAEPTLLRLLVVRRALLLAFGLCMLVLVQRPPGAYAAPMHAVTCGGGAAARKRDRGHLVGAAVRAVGVICTCTIVFVICPRRSRGGRHRPKLPAIHPLAGRRWRRATLHATRRVRSAR